MNKILLPLLSALVLFACGGKQASLEGTWKIAPSSVQVMIKDAPPEAQAQAKALAEQMTMTFKGGKCTAVVPGFGTQEGTYTVKSSDGNKLTVETVMDDKKEEMVITIDGDRFTTTMDGQEMAFVRS